MLKGIHPLLIADLLHALAAMGHGDEIAIVDANFPATRLGTRVIELPGASSPECLAAVPGQMLQGVGGGKLLQVGVLCNTRR